jgi:hypothetical protein
MLKMIAMLTTFGMVGTTALAAADGPPPTDCPRPKKRKRLPPKKAVTPPEVKPEPPKATADCNCTGLQGPPGQKGEDGIVVYTERYIHQHLVVEERPSLSLGLGAMGAFHAPDGDWAWGPALQLRNELSDLSQLTLEAGFALPIDGVVGDETGLLLHLGYTRFLSDEPWFGFTGGVHYTGIDGSAENGNIDGHYLGVDLGFVVRKQWDNVNLRVEFAPMVSGLRDDSSEGTSLSLGLTSSAFLGWSL